MEVKVKLVDGGVLPVYASDAAVGCDFCSIEDVVVKPDTVIGIKLVDDGNGGKKRVECAVNDPEAVYVTVKRNPVVVRTGVMLELPEGYELEIRSRSGLGFKYDVHCFNGTIDSDYRGEIMLKIYNLGVEEFEIKKGMRLAQGIIKKVVTPKFVVVDSLSETKRGDGGFGHTGI